MKLRIITFVFCIVLLLTSMTKAEPVQAISMDSDNKLAFLLALDEHLAAATIYYQKGSVKMVDGLDLEGKITKLIKANDPNTEENEEVIEEYTSQIAVGFVEFNEIRDYFFTFKKKEFYYYDLDKKEFLTANQVFLNDEVKNFFKLYMDDIEKKQTAFSHTILLLLISLLIIVPVFAMIFHNKGRSSVVNIYQYD